MCSAIYYSIEENRSDAINASFSTGAQWEESPRLRFTVQAVQCFTVLVLYLYVQRVAFGGTSSPRTPTSYIWKHRAHTDTDTTDNCTVYCMQESLAAAVATNESA